MDSNLVDRYPQHKTMDSKGVSLSQLNFGLFNFVWFWTLIYTLILFQCFFDLFLWCLDLTDPAISPITRLVIWMRTFWLLGTQTLYLNTARFVAGISMSLGQGGYQTSPPTRGGPAICIRMVTTGFPHPTWLSHCFPVCFTGIKKAYWIAQLKMLLGGFTWPLATNVFFLSSTASFCTLPLQKNHPDTHHCPMAVASPIQKKSVKNGNSFMPAKLASSQLLSTPKHCRYHMTTFHATKTPNLCQTSETLDRACDPVAMQDDLTQHPLVKLKIAPEDRPLKKEIPIGNHHFEEGIPHFTIATCTSQVHG